MKMTNQDYGEYVKTKSPNSKTGRNLIRAFLTGGVICCVGQGLNNLYQSLQLNEETAATAASITLVFLGALLTGLNLYDNIAKFAGAGTLVPITGFANSVVAPALEFKTEGYVMGLGAKMFTIAGPVIVYGTAASVIYGLVLVLIRAL